ncbi:MAG: patatin-like phospholipase family protein [Candidatus Nanoarchaeia archaeon]
MKKYDLALVLSGGGARGMAHVGVIKVFEENKIVPNIIIGTSAGALVGGMYAANSLDKFEKVLIGKLKNFIRKSIARLWFSKEGLINSQKVANGFRKIVGNKNIENLDKKFVAIACDLISGKKVLIEKGDLCDAIVASSAIPFVFSPLHKKDKINKKEMLLVDGGIKAPLAIEEGIKLAKKVIAVNLSKTFEIKTKKSYNIIDVFSYLSRIWEEEVLSAILKKYRNKKNVFLLNIDVNINTLDFRTSKKAIKIGEKEAKKRLNEIKRFINS